MFGISDDDPSEIRAAVESDPDRFVDEYDRLVGYAGENDAERRAVAARCFAVAAEEYPSLVTDEAGAMLSLFDADDPEVRADAADALATALTEGGTVEFDAADRTTVAGLLEDDSAAVRAAGADLLATAADERPTGYVSFVPNLERLASASLDAEGEAAEAGVAALQAILEVIRETPDVAGRVDDTLAAAVERAPPDGVEAALRGLYYLAGSSPDEFQPHHGAVRSALDADHPDVVRYRAAKVYHKLAVENGDEALERVTDAVGPILSVYADCDSRDDRSTLGHALSFYPGATTEPFDSLPDPYPSDLRDGVAGAVGLAHWVADADPSLVVEYVPTLAAPLGDESLDGDVRADAAWALVHVGLHAPEELRDAPVDPEAVVSVLEENGGSGDEIDEFRAEFDVGSEASRFRAADTGVTFDDVVGMDELKRTARGRIIDPLERTDLYERFGVEIQRGFLFHGPPGTGKTHFARALANESGFTFFEVDVADIASTTVGQAPENVADLFERAVEAEPSLVLLDEIDAIATSRGTNQVKSQRQVVNQLLESLSRIEAQERDVVVVGATNRAEDVDDALLRSGRLGERVEFHPPDAEARVELFDRYCEPTTRDLTDEWLREETEGLVQADVSKLGEAAAYEALRRYKRGENDDEVVTHADVEAALGRLERTAAKEYDYRGEVPDLTFDDVVGMEGLKEIARGRIVDPLESADLYERFGVEVQRGFLFHGPPGTGKTYFARALAGESEFTFLDVAVDDVVSKYIGEGARRIGEVFDQAVVSEPCIVFLDEIDALATSRGTDQTKSERQMVNQLLDSISGLEDEERDVVVVGATNRVEDVDDAILRSGRLGERIEFGPPDADARVELFETYCEPGAPDLDREWLRAETEGLVQADVAKLAEAAAYRALRRHRRGENDAGVVTHADVEAALARLDAREDADGTTDEPSPATDAFY